MLICVMRNVEEVSLRTLGGTQGRPMLYCGPTSSDLTRTQTGCRRKCPIRFVSLMLQFFVHRVDCSQDD